MLPDGFTLDATIMVARRPVVRIRFRTNLVKPIMHAIRSVITNTIVLRFRNPVWRLPWICKSQWNQPSQIRVTTIRKNAVFAKHSSLTEMGRLFSWTLAFVGSAIQFLNHCQNLSCGFPLLTCIPWQFAVRRWREISQSLVVDSNFSNSPSGMR